MPSRRKSDPYRNRMHRGHTLVELVAALSITALAATTMLSGVAALRDAVSLLAGRQRLVGALEYARREAYRRGDSARARPDIHGRVLRVTIADMPVRTFALDRVRIVEMPARGHVRFFASGLAENATFTIANDSGARADVVINQRGEIRWR